MSEDTFTEEAAWAAWRTWGNFIVTDRERDEFRRLYVETRLRGGSRQEALTAAQTAAR